MSDVFLIVIFPLSASTFLLKFKTIFASSDTLVALSAGVDELKVGKKKAAVGVVPKPLVLP